MKIPQTNEIYKHFKGNLYKIVTIAIHSETLEKMVVYQALYGNFDIYVRPLDMFVGKVDKEKYPEVKQEYRFEPMEQLVNIAAPLEAASTESTIAGEEEKDSQITDSVEEEMIEMDPLLIEFMDAYTYEERLNILVALHHRITDDMINVIAAVLDIEVEAGDLETRYQSVKNCIITLEKFECNRLR
ncbi:MAG: DUF1653 domain-containing protein [Eubacteriales bacterium]